MSENETKKEEEFDTKRARRACSITFLVLILIFVAPILTLYLLILHACHQEPDLSDYHLIGETVVLSGKEFDYHITYESLSVKYPPKTGSKANVIKLSVSIDEGVEIPDVLYFFTTTDISRIESNGREGAIYKKLSILPGQRIEVLMETNPCEIDLYFYRSDFKGYVKFGLTGLTVKQSLNEEISVEAIEFKLY